MSTPTVARPPTSPSPSDGRSTPAHDGLSAVGYNRLLTGSLLITAGTALITSVFANMTAEADDTGFTGDPLLTGAITLFPGIVAVLPCILPAGRHPNRIRQLCAWMAFACTVGLFALYPLTAPDADAWLPLPAMLLAFAFLAVSGSVANLLSSKPLDSSRGIRITGRIAGGILIGLPAIGLVSMMDGSSTIGEVVETGLICLVLLAVGLAVACDVRPWGLPIGILLTGLLGLVIMGMGLSNLSIVTWPFWLLGSFYLCLSLFALAVTPKEAPSLQRL
ncbi:hypothetical protein NQ038_04335 [Brevibacterium sp. 50QC2O2]|uniref:hypothetical protein n=1 Tax=Brevibacterium TaxID=1696 RepID=UPI00211C4FED|nr:MULTISPECIES: hypothetical protein [unclassified Brevibacterium]MCQ9367443.1 hypothetical protein [Brevibacterium sp. 91QC2O2]MCQ9384543.1 hypothetical protein [Brevibacterium sp. 68QC2CO]MCQ9387872.1 hypothetical protein [Brevibacterium sp. 50QC2O2]